MFQRTVAHSTLLRMVGACFILFGLYVIAVVLTAQIHVVGSVQYSGPMIFQDPMDLENYLFYGGPLFANFVLPGAHQVVYLCGLASPGPLLWVGLEILCVSLTTRRMLIAYLGLLTALWMISAPFISLLTPCRRRMRDRVNDLGRVRATQMVVVRDTMRDTLQASF
jgi:hypothetical protein